MLHFLAGLVLDADDRQLAYGLVALAGAAATALLLAVAIPIALLVSSGAGGSNPAPSGLARAVFTSSGVAPLPVAPPPAPQAPIDLRPTSAGSQAVEVAQRYLGVPYVFGGTNPAIGLDCSGLVQLVYRQVGISLPRTAQLQYEATQRVPRDQLQPGDLVFFARTYADPRDWVTHVGIYIGGGMQINAPTEGQVVSIQPVFSGFWGDHYTGAGRPSA